MHDRSRQRRPITGRATSPRTAATLEAVVLQLRATLAVAEAALAEVADIVGCSEETIRRRIRDGQLHAVTSGARWLVSAPALDRYLSGDSSSSTTAA